MVPTTYEFAGGLALDSCQYSVTDQFKSAHDPSKGFVLPGVFFIYDISPIKVKFTEKTTSFTCAAAPPAAARAASSRPPLTRLGPGGGGRYFLTSLCAIVGGVFTVAGARRVSRRRCRRAWPHRGSWRCPGHPRVGSVRALLVWLSPLPGIVDSAIYHLSGSSGSKELGS